MTKIVYNIFSYMLEITGIMIFGLLLLIPVFNLWLLKLFVNDEQNLTRYKND